MLLIGCAIGFDGSDGMLPAAARSRGSRFGRVADSVADAFAVATPLLAPDGSLIAAISAAVDASSGSSRRDRRRAQEGRRHSRPQIRPQMILSQALARGVPVCVVPFGRDQFEVARRVEVARCGTRLPARKLTAARLSAKVRQAMTMTDGVRRVAAGFAATGGVARGAELIEQRVLGGAPELPVRQPARASD